MYQDLFTLLLTEPAQYPLGRCLFSTHLQPPSCGQDFRRVRRCRHPLESLLTIIDTHRIPAPLAIRLRMLGAANCCNFEPVCLTLIKTVHGCFLPNQPVPYHKREGFQETSSTYSLSSSWVLQLFKPPSEEERNLRRRCLASWIISSQLSYLYASSAN